jgi:UDP:flavonoid glycosyltransferase YjiC (YdhE family)
VLKRYLAEELKLLEAVRPDWIVANFRPSLAVSAPLRGVPLATVVSAHWSPYAERDEFPVPDHPTVSRVGLALARRFVPKALPAAFALFAGPINALRKKHGLSAIGSLPEVMTWGDLTLHPDIPELAPTRRAPSSHHYLGRVDYSAPVALPSWWNELPTDRPTVYVTLGSSGNLKAWPALAQGLGELPVNVMLATAGRLETGALPANFWVSPLLPGEQAAERAALVITNGGSGSSYQALAAGKPVIGVASNLDQHLSMSAIERAGAGRLLRAGNLDPAEVRASVSDALASTGLSEAARQLATQLGRWDASARFVEILDQATRQATARFSA